MKMLFYLKLAGKLVLINRSNDMPTKILLYLFVTCAMILANLSSWKCGVEAQYI